MADEEITPRSGDAAVSGKTPVSSPDTRPPAPPTNLRSDVIRPVSINAGDDVRVGAGDGVRAVGDFPAIDTPRTPEEAARPVGARLRDPLSEVGRKERRSLLAVAMVAILVGHTGLVPEKIQNLGITFAAPERVKLLWVAVAVVVYYLIAFIVYAVND